MLWVAAKVAGERVQDGHDVGRRGQLCGAAQAHDATGAAQAEGRPPHFRAGPGGLPGVLITVLRLYRPLGSHPRLIGLLGPPVRGQ